MNPISIVGAGPGALDLMTIRAQQRLKSADVLVWTDSLIPIQITKLVKDDCEKIKTSSLTLEEICLLYTSPSPRDRTRSRMPSSA